MSRIITDNYKEKLNSLINKFKFSPNLSELINFFKKEYDKEQQNRNNQNRKIFSLNAVEKLNALEKLIDLKESDESKKIFAYISKIIKTFSRQYCHIHINLDLHSKIIENLITLFTWEVFVSSYYNNNSLKTEQEQLSFKADVRLGLNLTGIAGPEENRLRRERKGWRHRKRFIDQIMKFDSSCAKNGVLLNLNLSASDYVNLSEFSKFPDPMNNYVNFGQSLQDIYDKNNTILQNITTILNLFPAERGPNIWYSNFIAENINAWNQFPEYNFGKVITITAGEKTPETLLEIQKQNRFQSEEFYTIFSFEL
jgi:hypothetical protein